MFYTRCAESKTFLKCCKIPKYYVRDCSETQIIYNSVEWCAKLEYIISNFKPLMLNTTHSLHKQLKILIVPGTPIVYVVLGIPRTSFISNFESYFH